MPYFSMPTFDTATEQFLATDEQHAPEVLRATILVCPVIIKPFGGQPDSWASLKDSDYPVIVKEHMEKTARLIFGDDVLLQHDDTPWFTYNKDLEIYTALGAGVPVNTPIVRQYEDMGEYLEAEIAYLGTFVDDLDYYQGEELIALCENAEPIYRTRLGKREDGTIYYLSHEIVK